MEKSVTDGVKNIPSFGYFLGLAKEAGEIIRQGFNNSIKTEWKKDGTPVTEIDKRINDLVLTAFKCDFPQISVFSEEGNREVEGSDMKVICDPLDGTSAFLAGIPVSAFCISLIIKEEPFFAAIYDPFLDRMWWAKRGRGAFLNGEKIRVSDHNKLSGSVGCVVYWKNAPYNLAKVSECLMAAGVIWMSPPSIAYFGGLTAMGQMHFTIFPGSKPLETAAMHLIVEEAGGKATDIFGRVLNYGSDTISGHIMSNGAIHGELVQMVMRVMKANWHPPEERSCH